MCVMAWPCVISGGGGGGLLVVVVFGMGDIKTTYMEGN